MVTMGADLLHGRTKSSPDTFFYLKKVHCRVNEEGQLREGGDERAR